MSISDEIARRDAEASLLVRSRLQELMTQLHSDADKSFKNRDMHNHAVLCMAANKVAGLLKESGGYVPNKFGAK